MKTHNGGRDRTDFDNDFDRFLRKLKMGDATLAKKLGAGRKTLIAWRENPDTIKLKNVLAIADEIGVDRHYLMDVCLGIEKVELKPSYDLE